MGMTALLKSDTGAQRGYFGACEAATGKPCVGLYLLPFTWPHPEGQPGRSTCIDPELVMNIYVFQNVFAVLAPAS